MTNIYNLFMDYQNLLKRIRDALLVSQADLAKILNVTFATVNRWENGEFKPTMKMRRKLAPLFKEHGIVVEE